MFRELPTPIALVDLDVFARNIERGRAQAERLGVALRPHAKTVKSPALMAQVVTAGVSGLTVSTLTELETLRELCVDIMYAVPTADRKQPRILEALANADIRLTLVVDSIEATRGVPSDSRIDVAIEVDCDGRRGGVEPDSDDLLAIGEVLGPRLRGVMTHAGAAYVVSPAGAAVAERDAVVGAASRLRKAGHDFGMVSVGSSPSFFAAERLDGVSEARPGVYLFGDESQVALGSARADEVALTVLATVIGRRGGTAIVDAGWSALSQDRGAPVVEGSGLGVVDGVGDLIVEGATQEHGMVVRRDGGDPGLAIGDRIRIRPLHACATAEMHQYLVTTRGDRVMATVERPRGW